MAPNAHSIISVLVFAGIGVYTGVKFFEPIVIAQLKKDGALRDDIEIPEFDENGERKIEGVKRGPFWEELRQRLESAPEDKAKIQLDLKDLAKPVSSTTDTSQKK